MSEVGGKVKLSAFTVIKNGVKLGYPFLESFTLVLPFVDTLYIQEGYSDDDTLMWLQRLKLKWGNKVQLTRYHWPQQATGFSIGTATNMALAWVRISGASHLLYVQADELWHPASLKEAVAQVKASPHLEGWNVPFLHLQNNMQEVQQGAGYDKAIRLVRNDLHIRSHRDAWTFEGCKSLGEFKLPVPLIHNNRSFWHNVPLKLRSHADALYADLPYYWASAEEAERVHESETVPELWTRATSPFWEQLPELVRPLLGQLEYVPREELVA